jgi:(S)-3,5-dihydroxyphenylglycine transaminase
MKLMAEDLHASISDPVLDRMNFLNEITFRYPSAISFAPGRPYDGLFETEQIIVYIRRYMDYLAARGNSVSWIRSHMYQYGPAAGQIQSLIANSLRTDESISAVPESIVVTVGAQEAMLVVLRALITGPRDVLLVSSPCYVGITGAARLLEAPVSEVPERDGSISVPAVEAAILAERARGRRPRAFYVVPDYANPSGSIMDLPSRAALLEVAARQGILIIEDNPYRLVSPAPRLPTLKSLDRDQAVIYLGSFSKTVFPGTRVGFVVADQDVVGRSGRASLLAGELAKIKSMVTVNTSSLSQAAVAGALLAGGGGVAAPNTGAAAHYRQNMTATIAQLDRLLPADRRRELGVKWNQPGGGFFVSLEVAFPADDDALVRSAQEFGVIWTPMAYFYPGGGGERGIRLSTSYLTSDDITTGMARLVRFIESESTSR